ncbi:MAG: Rieske 2Fe-2S domain-containing protein [Chloroflexi bacterium]|nr:Rieske 2Fe-2S domain-containing protein [Chloroflexota bacterium]
MAENKRTESTQKDVTRRDFLKIAWGAAGALALAEAGGVALSFFSPRVVEGAFGGVIEAGMVDSFPPGSVTPFTQGRFYLVRMPEGGFVALYRKCTHLGCAVPWNPAEGRFVCPCHASAFEMDGQLINAPAPRPLDRFAITIENGMVKVDTGTSIQRDQPSDADLVYAEVGA